MSGIDDPRNATLGLPTAGAMNAQADRLDKIPGILARAQHLEAIALGFLRACEAVGVQAATTLGGPVAGLGAQLARAQLDAVIRRKA